MKIFDTHVRSTARGEADLKNLHYFETERVLTTSYRAREFQTAEDLLGYFEDLLSVEPVRLTRCGLVPHVALGVAPNMRPKRTHHEIWRDLPQLVAQREVVAIGEIGVWDDVPWQWELFERQVRMGLDRGGLPLLVSSPQQLRATMTYRMMEHLGRTQYPTSRVVFLECTAAHMENVVQSGFAASLAVGTSSPDARALARTLAEYVDKYGQTERIMLASGLREGISDVLGVPKVAMELNALGLETSHIERLVFGNAMKIFVRADANA